MNKKLIAILCCIMLTGCTTETKINKPKTIKEETPVVLTTKGHDVKEAVNKSETITVKTKASGEIKSTKAEVTIPSISEGDLIKDTTVLKDISNKGDENITLNNHQLLIENNKNSIQYEGTLDTTLPVGVDVTYYLDGQRVTDIKGKTGTLKAVFKYKNSTETPFVATTIMLIPQETVSDIEVKNGKSMLMDDYQAIVGLGCPGYEPFKDSMEVTMKIKNFQCDYMSTVFTDGIFKDLDLSELTKTTDQLNQSAQKLVEGSAQLLAGCTTYGQYLHTYMSNVSKVSKVSDGANALLKGSKQYDASTQALIKNLISSMKDPTELIQSKINNIDLTDEQRAAVNRAISEGVQESLIQNKKSLEQLSQLLSQSPVSKQLETLSSSLSELSQAGNELSQQYQTLVTGAKSLSEGMSLFDQEGIQKITDITTIKKLKEKDNYSGLSGNNITNTKFIFEMDI